MVISRQSIRSHRCFPTCTNIPPPCASRYLFSWWVLAYVRSWLIMGSAHMPHFLHSRAISGPQSPQPSTPASPAPAPSACLLRLRTLSHPPLSSVASRSHRSRYHTCPHSFFGGSRSAHHTLAPTRLAARIHICAPARAHTPLAMRVRSTGVPQHPFHPPMRAVTGHASTRGHAPQAHASAHAHASRR